MPKLKTSRAAAKRFKKTGTGKLVRTHYKQLCSGDFSAHIISHSFVLPGCDLK